MIPFSIKVLYYKLFQRVLKWVAMMVPIARPTLFQGPGSALAMCDAIEQMGVKRLLLVTDAMLVKLGLVDGIKGRLESLGVSYVIYDGVLPDPTIDQIEVGLTTLLTKQCDAILAVGGGSSIDAAKIIAARATHPKKPIRKMDGLFKLRTGTVPLFAVPTTAGTGSEVTLAAVVSDPGKTRKFAVADPKLVPQLAALDGTLMTGLPPAITAATGMDALTHAIEAYVSTNALPETDQQALAATRIIMTTLPRVMEDGSNVDDRQAMALASHYAGLAFTRAGVGYVHAIAHNFGAYYHVPHGVANAIVLPYVLEFSKSQCLDRLARLAQAAGLDTTGNASNEELADALISHIRHLKERFGIPAKLDKIKREDIPAIAKAALKEAHSTYAVPRYMNRKECEALIQGMMA